MRVEIIRGTVEHNHRVYAIGDVIKQISRADGDRLIEKKAAVEYFEKPVQNESNNAEDKQGGTSENTGDGENTIITTEDAGDDSTATPSEDDSETDETVDEDEE